nr:MAG TPA: hypothetical protein [Caudoviricetes sp.]
MLDSVFFSDEMMNSRFDSLKEQFSELNIDMDLGTLYNEYIGVTLEEDYNKRTKDLSVDEELFIGHYTEYSDDFICDWGYQIKSYISEYDFSGTEGETSMIIYDGDLLFNRLKYIQGLMGSLTMLQRVPDELLKKLCDFVTDYWPLKHVNLDNLQNNYSTDFLKGVVKRSLMFVKEDNEWPREIFHINSGDNDRYFVRGVKVPKGNKYDLEAEYSFIGEYGYYTENILYFNKEYTLKDLVDISKGSNNGWANKMHKAIRIAIQAIADNKYKEPIYEDTKVNIDPKDLEKIKILQEQITGRMVFPTSDDLGKLLIFNREEFTTMQPPIAHLSGVIKLEPKEEEE